MKQTTHTPDTLRTKLAAAIQRDIKTAKKQIKKEVNNILYFI